MNANQIFIIILSLSILLNGLFIFDKFIKREDSANIISAIVKNPEALELLITSEPKLIQATIKKDPSFLIPIIKEDHKLFEFLLESKFANLESIIQKKIDKDPNIRLRALKDLNNLYESLLQYKENSESNKKLILKEYANSNFAIGSIYSDINNKVRDIKGRLFDSFNSKITLAENYFIMALDLFGKINDCDYLRITKNNFCDAYREIEKLSENDEERRINFKKIINSELNKCLRIC